MGSEENKEENLRKLLRENGSEKLSFHFTEKVTKAIEAELQNQAIAQSQLQSLLQKNAIEQPSASFQANIISQLNVRTTVVNQPILSRKAWFGIAAALVLLLVASYFYPSATPIDTPRILTFLGRAVRSLKVPREIPDGTFEIVVFTLMGLSALLLLDHYVRRKFSHYNKLARS